MTCVAMLMAACAFSAFPPLQPDTPPPLPISVTALDSMRTMQDVINASVLASGGRAPANLLLPQLLNYRETIEFVLANYPTQLRDMPSSSQPFAWILINKSGNIEESYLVKSSGHGSLDSLVLKVFGITRFAPAAIGNEAVGVWVPYPVQIGSYRQLLNALEQLEQLSQDPCDAPPRFTPFTTKPRLLNREEVSAALVRLYPPELRQQGIEGSTLLWACVDKAGAVINALVHTSSANGRLDNAAVQVANSMRFSPALNLGKPVNVWIQLPIRFKARVQ